VVHAPATPPSPPAVRASGWLASLRERKVVQWSLAYAAAAAALLQVLALVAAQFAWPDAVARSATVVLACGIPVAAVIAWYHGDRGAQRVAGTELLILALLFTFGAGVLWRVNAGRMVEPIASSRPPAAPGTPRIAVLPLDNLSPDPANAFFADGLHDELLAALTRLGSVEVVSRTTMLSYRTGRPSTRALAAELGATHLLEGTVRREGDTVRLSLQLIDAPADRHLWAETYTRQVSDTLALQGEIALAVAGELHARIAPANRAGLAVGSVIDPRALDALLQARQVHEVVDVDGYRRRRALLDAAVAAAPGFGEARAERASHRALSAWFARGDEAALAAGAREDLAIAERTAPDALATALARVTVRYYLDRDFAGALADADAALARWPLAADLLGMRMRLLRRVGRFEEAIAAGERAIALDPRNPDALETPIENLRELRRDYAGALSLAARQAALSDNAMLANLRSHLEFLRTGDFEARLAECRALAPRFEREFDADTIWRRRLGWALEAGDWTTAARLADAAPGPTFPETGARHLPIPALRLRLAFLRGDADAVVAAVPAAVQALHDVGARRPNDPFPWLWLASAHVAGGDPAAARAALARGLALAEADPDVLARAGARNEAVYVEAELGNRDEALARLRVQLQAPWGWHAAAALHDPRLVAAMGDHAGYRALQSQLRASLARAAGVRPPSPAPRQPPR
jgi:TolB-like protein